MSPPQVCSCIDLVLKWCTLRMCDSQAQTTVRVVSLLEQLFAMLVEHGCQLSDYDVRAAALPPRARLTSCGEISWRS